MSKRIALSVVLFLFLLVLLDILGLGIPVQVLLSLVIGWILFFYRVVPNLHYSGSGISSGMVWFGLLVIGLAIWYRRIAQSVATVAEVPGGEVAASEGVGVDGKATSGGGTSITWLHAIWVGFRGSLALLLLFVSSVCIIGIVHQSYWLSEYPGRWTTSGVGEVARRSQSQDYLHNLVIGAHNFNSAKKSQESEVGGRRLVPYPLSGGEFSPEGRGRHGWVTYMLPFIEQKPLYDRIDLDRDWDDPVNKEPMSKEIGLLMNYRIRPPDGRLVGGYGPAHYAANVHVMGPNRGYDFEDIPDGSSQTIVFGEITTAIPAWGSPTNFRNPMLGLGSHPHGFGGPWKDGGTQFGFADGRVMLLSPDIDPAVLKALSTPAGGDTLRNDWWRK
ncbi:MAG: DUF1559 domain-containing protein [Planctomycetaceae bacterium]